MRCAFHQCFGSVFSDLQQPHGGAGWGTQAPFPRNGGGFGNIEEVGKDGLADIHALADVGDFLPGECFGTRGAVVGAGGDFSGSVIRALPHAGKEILEAEIRNFVVFWHNWI